MLDLADGVPPATNDANEMLIGQAIALSAF
jgi:hypothetical protein